MSVGASSVVSTMSAMTFTLILVACPPMIGCCARETSTLCSGCCPRVDRGLEDGGRVDQIRKLETLKCAAEAAQAVLSADLDTSMRARAAEAGVPAARQGRGVAAQLAFARRESLHRGERHLGLAKTLPGDAAHVRPACGPDDGVDGDPADQGDRVPVP